jgi:hypothetical protein
MAALRVASANDSISTREKIEQLKKGLANHFKDENYYKCKSMTDLIELNVKNVIRQIKL